MQSIAVYILLESVMQFAEENNNKTTTYVAPRIKQTQYYWKYEFRKKPTNLIFVVFLF